MKPIILAGALLLSASAYAAEIFPNPQSVTDNGTAFASASATYRLTGADAADADAVAALRAKLPVSDAGTIEIIIGEKGDDAVSAYADKIPANEQGYYLTVDANRVVIAGADNEGTYYGVQSFLQLASQPQVSACEVLDWPTIADRGVIEGYYGNPWSQEDCMDMFEFFDHNKMNVFIYGPKNDPYHKSNWAEAYPADKAAELQQLATEGLKHKVHFVWSIHPGNAIEGDNMEKAKQKFLKMYDLGIRQFGVFFDDIGGEKVDAQIAYLNFINKEIVKAKPDVAPLIVCPTEYCISFAGGQNTSSQYLPKLGAGLDSDIQIMWTGAGVVDMNQNSAADWFTNKTGRKPYIWLNYPVNDYGYEGGPLLMSPYEAPDAQIPSKIQAFCSNPMEYYEASKVALYGIGDFTWNPTAYNADANWEKALSYLFPDNTDAFRTYCQSNFYYPQCTHGLVVKWHETPEFKALIDADKTINANNAAAYRAYFDNQVATADELLGLTDHRMVQEIKEWIEVYRMQGERGQLVDDMFSALQAKNGDAFLAAYVDYMQLTDSADHHLSREGWPVRNYLPKSAPEYVRGWMSDAVETLIQQFKDGGYDYPADLFPFRVLETGTYYILYNGKYLSNGTGAAANSPAQPQFLAAIDNINPARQSWRLEYIPTKGRYALRSVHDNRYVNEIMNFASDRYSDDWNTYEITPLGELYAIQNAERGGTKYWTVNSSDKFTQGTSTAWNLDNFKFQIVSANETVNPDPKGFEPGEYYILNEEGKALNRNSSTNELTFVTLPENPTSTFKWTLAVESSGRISIKQGTRYINELGVIGTNPFYVEWNTYEILLKDGKLAIRNAGSAGTQYWTIGSDGKITKGSQSRNDSFVFRLKSTSDNDAINSISVDADESETTYDLQGRRVANPAKGGIYVRNGRKFLVK